MSHVVLKPLFAFAVLWLFLGGLRETVRAESGERLDSRIRPYLQEHCVKCHGPEKQKGKFRVDTLTDDFSDFQNVAHWIEVRDNINLGEMPPDDEPLPEAKASEEVSDWIALGIKAAERAALAKDGRVLMRRLNRAEYTNTVRDLLGMEFLPGDSPLDFLPPDGRVEGFDKVSAALMIDPSLLAKYYEVASEIAEAAIVTGPPAYPTETMRMEFSDIGKNRAIDYLCDRPGFTCFEDRLELISGTTRSFARLKYPGENRTAPVMGRYRVSIKAGARRGTDGEPVKLRLNQSHPDDAQSKVMEVEVEATPENPKVYSVVLPRDPNGGEWQVSRVGEIPFLNGNQTYRVYSSKISEAGKAQDYATVIRYTGRAQLEGGHEQTIIRPDRIETDDLPMLHLEWIEIEGPLYEQWPPKSHEFVFPNGTEGAAEEAAIRETFARLLTKAWRRPVAEEEIEPYVAYVTGELAAGKSIEKAMRAGLAGVLASPHFLYLYEPSDSEESRPINSFEMASRLSYFLWNSMPDDELFSLASAGKLTDEAVILEQVDRMIADPKIEGFVQGFGVQWLRIDSFLAFQPDARQYPDYDEDLGEAVVEETTAFFREILKQDLDLRNFIDSDFTFVNERLAQHYGIDGVKGKEFRRVSLPAEANRGGLLGQAGVHLAGSDGDRTKPVTRGIYVLEVLFNDPPHPPPPNAGEIEPNIKGEKLTVRERLEQHQEIESCASCHRGIDPYGMAMENYDVIGSWRTIQNGEGFRPNSAPEIDASGKLPNGATFTGIEDFKELLLAQDERFFRGLTEKMLVYALGRPHLPSDRSLVDEIVRELKEDSPTLRTLLKRIATSRPFLEK